MRHLLWVIITAAGVLSLTVASSSAAKSQVKAAKDQKILGSLVEVGELGENLYDLTKANDWTNAAAKLQTLKAASKQLGNDLPGIGAELKRLEDTLKDLDKSVAAKDKQATLRAANQVTLIAADIVEPFNPQIPAAVTRLDYYGRELEILVAAKDKEKLLGTGKSMRSTWEKLQPKVSAKGGEAEAKRFNGLMTQLAAAKTIEDFDRLVTPILDEVDNLEKVFKQEKKLAAVAEKQRDSEEWTTGLGENKADLSHTGRIHGTVVSHEGSRRSGMKGAKFGLMMSDTLLPRAT